MNFIKTELHGIMLTSALQDSNFIKCATSSLKEICRIKTKISSLLKQTNKQINKWHVLSLENAGDLWQLLFLM